MKRTFATPTLCLLSSAAFAQNVIGSGVLGDLKVSTGGGVTATYLASGAKGANFAPSYTSGSFSIGAASSDRILIACVGAAQTTNGAFSSFDFGASAATAVTGTTIAAPWSGEMFYLNVPTGTTTTITINSGTTINYLAWAVWSLSGQSGGGSATPNNATAVSRGSAAEPISLAQTVTSGGAAFNCAFGNGAGSQPSSTWTNTTAGAGDATPWDSGAGTPSMAVAHSTATATVTASTTPDTLSFNSTMSYTAFAP